MSISSLAPGPCSFFRRADKLDLEALAQAVQTAIDDVGTWVMTAEHLAAIALRTGRPKDHNRILQFIEQGAIDKKALKIIVERHNLTREWQMFERRFLEGAHG